VLGTDECGVDAANTGRTVGAFVVGELQHSSLSVRYRCARTQNVGYTET